MVHDLPVRIWNDAPEFIKGVIEIVHSAPLSGVDVEADGALLDAGSSLGVGSG